MSPSEFGKAVQRETKKARERQAKKSQSKPKAIVGEIMNPPEPKRKRGRPANANLDDPAVVERICQLIISGTPVFRIVKMPDMPSGETFYNRCAKDEHFRMAIARARKARQEFNLDYCDELAESITPENWQAVRTKIWCKQWEMGKLDAPKYGPHIAIEPPKPSNPLDEFRAALMSPPVPPGQVNE